MYKMLVNSFFFFLSIGKILDDEKKIDEYKIEEKNFVVVMVTKVSHNTMHIEWLLMTVKS